MSPRYIYIYTHLYIPWKKGRGGTYVSLLLDEITFSVRHRLGNCLFLFCERRKGLDDFVYQQGWGRSERGVGQEKFRGELFISSPQFL